MIELSEILLVIEMFDLYRVTIFIFEYIAFILLIRLSIDLHQKVERVLLNTLKITLLFQRT